MPEQAFEILIKISLYINFWQLLMKEIGIVYKLIINLQALNYSNVHLMKS